MLYEEYKDNNYVKVIEVFAKEIKTDKTTFLVYSSLINGKFYKIKFRESVVNKPSKVGYFRIAVLNKDMSIKKGEDITTKSGEVKKANDIIWIHKIEEYEELTEEELNAKNELKLKEIFG